MGRGAIVSEHLPECYISTNPDDEAVCICDALRAAYKRGWAEGETEALLNTPCSSCRARFRSDALDDARAVVEAACAWDNGQATMLAALLRGIDALRGA